MDGLPKPTPGPAPAAIPPAPAATSAAAQPPPAGMASPTSLVTYLNVGLLLVGLWAAIGLTSEIVTRKEDFARVEGYHKWLATCATGSTDKDCRKFEDAVGKENLKGEITVAETQVRRYQSFNAFGAPDRCHIPVVFASQIGHFWEDCEAILREKANLKVQALREAAIREAVIKEAAPKDAVARESADREADRRIATFRETGVEKVTFFKPQNRTPLEAILEPPMLRYSWVGLDQHAKEPLYFALVLVAALIGSLIAGLRTAALTTHRDVALGLGAGFAVYILLRGGNFVFFSGGTSIDILNPFTAAAVGLLVGLYNDKAFGLLGNAMPTTPAPAAQGSPPAAVTSQAGTAMKNAELAQTNAVAAATRTHEGILAALNKTTPDSDAYKALQDMAAAALDAKTKAEEAAKAQGEAAKPR